MVSAACTYFIASHQDGLKNIKDCCNTKKKTELIKRVSLFVLGIFKLFVPILSQILFHLQKKFSKKAPVSQVAEEGKSIFPIEPTKIKEPPPIETDSGKGAKPKEFKKKSAKYLSKTLKGIQINNKKKASKTLTAGELKKRLSNADQTTSVKGNPNEADWGQTEYDLGVKAETENDWPGAEQHFVNSAALKNPEAIKKLSQKWYQQGMDLKETNLYKALSYFQKASLIDFDQDAATEEFSEIETRAHKGDHEAEYALGMIYLENKQIDSAKEFLSKAAPHCPLAQEQLDKLTSDF